MRPSKPKRGTSVGTVFMLILSATVLMGFVFMLPRLQGNAILNVADIVSPLQALDLPALQTSEIPIRDETRSSPDSLKAVTDILTPAPSATPLPTKEIGGTITISAGGSIALENAVRQSGYYQETKRYSFDEILSLIRKEWHTDISLISLENLVVPSAKVNDLIAPAPVMNMLSSAGIHTIALGFTQAYDHGFAGLLSTLTAAEAAHLDVVGAYSDNSAEEDHIREINGIKVSLMHFTENLSSKGLKALKKDNQQSVLPLCDVAVQRIEAARKAGAELIIVSVHWGTQGKTTITKKQRELAQSMADAGADIIIGTGSRRVQTVEWLTCHRDDVTAQALCCWSLGCLLSDSRTNGAVGSMLLHLSLRLDSKGKLHFDECSYTPTYIWRYKQDNMYSYRVVVANQVAPDGMDSDQQKAMEAAYQRTRNLLIDSVLTEK